MATKPQCVLNLSFLLLLIILSVSSALSYYEEEEEQNHYQERDNPYFYSRERFRYTTKTQHGNVKVLERFSKRSELLRGIDNYRLAVLEANPYAFVMPSHWDADSVVFVVRGRGTMTILHEEVREAHNIRQGDIVAVPSGVIVHLTNTDNREKLYIATIIRPISTPGSYKEFSGVGGKDPESFYRSFSSEVLEAAFNTPSDRLDRFFRRQSKGSIIKASEKEIKTMSRQASSRGGRGPSGESSHPYNLFDKHPSQSNDRGQMYEATSNEYHQLHGLDIDVSYVNISQGSMVAPSYNSIATKLALVVRGEGYFEIACPHVSDESRSEGGQEEQKMGTHYKRVSARISPGTAFIIPAEHPVVTVASGDENLEILCFGMNAEGNMKYFLAGGNNIWKQMEGEAKGLSFGLSAREVDEIFNAQRESVFLRGPEEARQHGESVEHPLAFILDTPGV